jgi:hypothetical protein
MKPLNLLTCVCLFAASLNTSVDAQSLPGKNLTATVRIRGVSIAGDTTTVSYSVVNGGGSAERLEGLTVSLPAVLKSMTNPGPDTIWVVMGAYRNRGAVHWAYIPGVAQGDSTPTLQLSAIGLPGIVTAWYQGDSVIVEDESSATPVTDYDVLDDLSNKIQTVSIGTALASLSSLVPRLKTLTDSSCALSWITNSGLCTALSSALAASPSHVLGYTTRLDSARAGGSAVTDAAYFMLKANADYILNVVDVSLVQLTYSCGNYYRIRNYNYASFPATTHWTAFGTTYPGPSPTIAGRTTDGPGYSDTLVQVWSKSPYADMATVSYHGVVIATASSGYTAC